MHRFTSLVVNLEMSFLIYYAETVLMCRPRARGTMLLVELVVVNTACVMRMLRHISATVTTLVDNVRAISS